MANTFEEVPKLPVLKTFSSEYLRNAGLDSRRNLNRKCSRDSPGIDCLTESASSADLDAPSFLGSFRPSKEIVFESEVASCSYDEEKEELAVGLSNGSTKLIGGPGGDYVATLVDHGTAYKKLPVTSTQFLPQRDDLLAVAYASGYIKFWDFKKGKCVQTVAEPQSILAFSFNHDGSRYVTVGSDAKVRIYDLESKKPLMTLEKSLYPVIDVDGHWMRIFAVKYHPYYPHQLVTSGWDRTLQFWDDRIKRSQRKISGLFICGKGIDLLGDRILTASWRKREALQLWDYRTARKLQDVNFSERSSFLYCCRFLSPSLAVAGGGQANMMVLTDLVADRELGSLQNLAKPVACVDGSMKKEEISLFTGNSETFHIIESK